MGEKALVEGQISDSMALVRKLDVTEASPTFAAWYFYHDAEDWRLLIAGPAFDALLPAKESQAYQILAEAMNELEVSSMSIADVKLLPSEAPLIQAISVMISTPRDALMRAHFIDNYINGIFLKEMFVLRSATRTATPAA
jgi:hypothetical protein